MGVYGVALYDKKSINKLLKYGIPKGEKAGRAEIPKWILKSQDKVKKNFIRGFFDTDGSIFCQKDYTKYAKEFDSKYHSKIRLRINGISSKLMEQCFRVLKKTGYLPTKRSIEEGFKNNRNNSKKYIIEINRISHIVHC